MTRASLLLLFAACASSSAPILVEHEDTNLLAIPESAYPDDAGDTRITRLVARGDHALVVGMGACIGKAIDRCLAGAPLWVRGDEVPQQLDSLRRPTSLLWTELTREGDAVVHRLPEGGEPSLTRIDAEGARALEAQVDSNPGLTRAVDGSVLAQVRRDTDSALMRVGVLGEEELVRGGWFAVEEAGEHTYVQAGDSELLTIAPDGEVVRWFEGATGIRSVIRDGIRVACAERAEGSELVEPATGARLLSAGSCASMRIASPRVVWNDADAWVWEETPILVTDDFVGDPRIEPVVDGWVVLDDERVRWIDRAGYEVRNEPLDAPATLHVRGEHVAVSWNDESGAHVRTFDGEGGEVVLEEGLHAVSTWLTDEGVVWITASRGGDEYLRVPPSEVFRVQGHDASSVLEGASGVTLYGSLLVANGALFALDSDMLHLADFEVAPREVAPGVFEYTEGGERVLARFDGELVELARATERFDFRASGAVRWQSGAGWSVGRLIDGDLHVGLQGLTSAQWLGAEIATIVRDGQAELCHLPAERTVRCWEVPAEMLVSDARVTDTGRLFAVLRDGDRDVLWYSTR